MADQKVVKMKLNVDLNCPKCVKKVKKALCKFPEIRDKVYNKKTNTVTITVCNDPKKLMNELYYKGDGFIKSIVIVEPQLETAPVPKETIWQPYLIPIPIWQPCHCGPYCETQNCQCYGRPIYENWGGGRQCCHECMYSQGCSIL